MENDIKSKVGLAIVNYLNYEDTQCLINQLNNLFNSDIEIVVVDNASSNDSYRQLCDKNKHQKNVKIIQTFENKGYGSGNNIGIEYLINKDVDKIIISNPDIKINGTNVIYELLRNMDKDIAIVAPQIVTIDGLFQNPYLLRRKKKVYYLYEYLKFVSILKYLYFFYLLIKGYVSPRSNSKYIDKTDVPKDKIDVFSVHGSFFMINVDFFKTNNLMPVFDGGLFMYGEENVLALRISRVGGRVVFVPYVKVVHVEDRSQNMAWGARKSIIALKQFFLSKKYILEKYK